jgi:diadenosine tetraphosphate (Ap4A) HIT family hydrolase
VSIHISSVVIPRLIRAYKAAFGMAFANIAQLGNLTTGPKDYHTHLHFMPRYSPEAVPVLNDQAFPDLEWGKALNIDPKRGFPVVPCTDELVEAIRKALSPQLRT